MPQDGPLRPFFAGQLPRLTASSSLRSGWFRSGLWTAKVAYVGQFSSDMHYNTFDLEANYVW